MRTDAAPSEDGSVPGCGAEVGGNAETLAGKSPCADLLDAVRGRVGRKAPVGSFVVFSRRTPSGLGLVLSALHTLGVGTFGAEGTSLAETLEQPASDGGGLVLRVPPPTGALALPDLSPLYSLYRPAVPGEQHRNKFSDLRPANDFYIGVVDRQRYVVNDGAFPVPAPLEVGLVPLYDPRAQTLNGPTLGEAHAGDAVLLLGFPQAGPEEGAHSVGRVLSDAEVAAALAALLAAGDTEGAVPYDPAVEFFVSARALPGMSGGGAFDVTGRLLGVLVRASTAAGVGPYTRCVRARYARQKLEAARVSSAASVQGGLAPYLDSVEP